MAVTGLDPRIIKVGINLDGGMSYYTDLAITARGIKYGNPNPGECRIQIDNLTRAHRNFILTQTSIFKPQNDPVKVTVEAGRKSIGTTLVFSGYVILSNVTQPPDIGIVMNCVNYFPQTNEIVNANYGQSTPLSVIAQGAANQMGKKLSFQGADKLVSNYTLSGSASENVNKLAQTGEYDVYVDNDTLTIKDRNKPIEGDIIEMNKNTGMIGIPEVTQTGIRFKCLINPAVNLGALVNLTSELNPAINGQYVIYAIAFDIATRENQFYYVCECQNALG